MTATSVPPMRQNAQTPQAHLNALISHLEAKVAALSATYRSQAAELAIIEEDLKAHEQMLKQTRRWWEECLLTT